MSDADTASCAICLHPLVARGRQTLSCGHVLHESCVLQLRRFYSDFCEMHGGAGHCPLCRSRCQDLDGAGAMMGRAALHHSRRQWEEAAGLLSDILEIAPDNHEAAVWLAEFYVKGKGVERNDGKAVQLYEQAHLAGHAAGTTGLGQMYKDGRGVKRDYGKALRLWEQAFAFGHPEAGTCLGVMYFQGKGVTQDFSKAEGLFEKAFLGGDPEAARVHGAMYNLGEEGFPQYFGRAAQLFEEGRLAGSVRAGFLLGSLYASGRGVQQDLCRAAQLYEEAHLAGDPDAAFSLNKVRSRIRKETRRNNASAHVAPSGSDPQASSCPTKGCEDCGRRASLKICTGCRRAWYCSVACQRRHRGVHREACQRAAKLSPHPVEHSSTLAKGVPPLVGAELPIPCRHPMQNITWADDDDSVRKDVSEAAFQNEQISEALLRSRPRNTLNVVALLEYSRNPTCFHRALMESDDLAACRDALHSNGLSADLPCGAKAFVSPEAFEPTLEAVRLSGIDLCPRHVLVQPSLELAVVKVVETGLTNPHKPLTPDGRKAEKAKVRCKARLEVPLHFAEAVVESGHEIVLSRTFIHIEVESSLRSAPSSGLVTASTSDVRFPEKNPRAA